MTEEETKCNDCEKKAKWYCSFCQEYFCWDCRPSHDWCMEYHEMEKL
jgi:hypothetical protein